MFLWCLLVNSVENLGTKGDYPPGTSFRHSTTHMDIFMALFMMCAIEVVVLKILTHEEQQQNENRVTSASTYFDSYNHD